MRSPHRFVLATAASVILAGCFHVDVNAPPRSAPVAARVAAYQQLRPTGELHTITTNQYGRRVDHDLQLVTAGGVTVKHADDLLPVLDENSAAARTARQSGVARDRKWTWMIGGSVVSLIGMGLFSTGMSMNLDDPAGDAGVGRERLGAGIMLGGAIAGAVGWYYYNHVEKSRRAATFANYDDGLRARLELCVDGLQLVDCARRTAR